jgi:C1A family cysteine protease
MNKGLYLTPRVKIQPHRRYKYRPPATNNAFLATAAMAPVVGAAALPSMVDLRPGCLAIRDQGQEGACSGFSTAAFRELSHEASVGSALAGYLAPAYLYAHARMIEGSFPSDNGASVTDEFAVLTNYGVCPESYLPYTADPSEAPTPASDVAASVFRTIGPLKVDWTNLISIKTALAASQAVTIAFSVFSSFEAGGVNGLLTIPNQAAEQNLGGHAVLVVGFDDGPGKQYWIVRNSWGTTWGDAGYCYMPYGYEVATWFDAWTSTPQP